MPKIPLRAYNRDIEKLIDNGQHLEAIAHCRQILRFYPKHIDTYRLLGKAFLESQRFNEAADILQRVLAVIPDDFISQIGMSMIREDERNLDAAIYHMERAFEVQPANVAIQDELRRLYGQRDGVEPPKIRLTRGSLVRMYSRGELYPQAIAELRVALAEDPERVDLQVLLARLYFLSGQKVQAAEAAGKLVTRLPYCYEAVHILAEVLPGTSRAADAKIYQERMHALDPYMAYVSAALPNTASVPDDAVQVDKLDYVPGEEEAAHPELVKAIITASDEAQPIELLPSWLAEEPPSVTFPTTPNQPKSDSAEQPAETAEIPAWMTDAGWAPSSGENVVEQSTPGPEESETDLTAADADIPAWLQELAPDTVHTQPAAESEVVDKAIEEDAEWLEEIMSTRAGKPSTSAGENDFEQASAQAEAIELPSWLSGFNQPDTSAEAGLPNPQESLPVSEGVPDWLQSLEDTNLQVEPQQAEEPVQEIPTASTPPEAAINEQPAAVEVVDEQSVSMEAAPVGEDEQIIAQVEPEADLTAPPVETLAPTGMDAGNQQQGTTSAGEVDQTMALLESLAANPVDQEMVTRETAQDLPEGLTIWPEKEPAAALPEEQQGEQSPAESPIIEPEAVEPISPVEKPDWLQESNAEISDGTAPTNIGDTTRFVPTEPSPEFSGEPAWLAGMQEVAAETPETASLDQLDTGPIPAEQDAVIPEWLQQLEEEPGERLASEAGLEQSVERAAEDTTGSHAVQALPVDAAGEPSQPRQGAPAIPENESETALAWLESLAAQQSLVESSPSSGQTQPLEPASETVKAEEVVSETEEEPGYQLENPGEPIQPGDAVAAIVAAEPAEPATEASIEAEAQGESLVEDQVGDHFTPVDDIRSAELESQLNVEKVAGLEAVLGSETSTPVEKDAGEQAIEEEGQTWFAEDEPNAEKTQPVVTRQSEEQSAAEPEAVPGAPVMHWGQEASSEAADEAMPEWIQDLGSFTPEADHPMPGWLQNLEETPVAEETSLPEIPPVQTDWVPEARETGVDVKPAAVEEEIDAAPEIEELTATPEAEPPAAPTPEEPITTPDAAILETEPSLLVSGQNSLAKGDIEQALSSYQQLIQNDQMLDETIHDLRQALSSYPTNPDIWQTLGDAYLHGNHLQDALDAYTKAEELIR